MDGVTKDNVYVLLALLVIDAMNTVQLVDGVIIAKKSATVANQEHVLLWLESVNVVSAILDLNAKLNVLQVNYIYSTGWYVMIKAHGVLHAVMFVNAIGQQLNHVIAKMDSACANQDTLEMIALKVSTLV